MILHTIGSGSFFDNGVKKLATALPRLFSDCAVRWAYWHSLVVVDCCFRLAGGGETALSLALGLFPKPGRSGMSEARWSRGHQMYER